MRLALLVAGFDETAALLSFLPCEKSDGSFLSGSRALSLLWERADGRTSLLQTAPKEQMPARPLPPCQCCRGRNRTVSTQRRDRRHCYTRPLQAGPRTKRRPWASAQGPDRSSRMGTRGDRRYQQDRATVAACMPKRGLPGDMPGSPRFRRSGIVDGAAQAGYQVITGAGGAVGATAAIGSAGDVPQVGLVPAGVDGGVALQGGAAGRPAARMPAQLGAPTLVPPTVNQPDWPWYLVLSYIDTPVLGLASKDTSGMPRVPPVRAEIVEAPDTGPVYPLW